MTLRNTSEESAWSRCQFPLPYLASYCHAEPQILSRVEPRLKRMDKRVLELTVSKTTEGVRRMRTDDSLSCLTACSFSVTAIRAVSVECVFLRLVRILKVVL